MHFHFIFSWDWFRNLIHSNSWAAFRNILEGVHSALKSIWVMEIQNNHLLRSSFQQCSRSPGAFSVCGEHINVDATRFSLEHRNHFKSKGAKGHRGWGHTTWRRVLEEVFFYPDRLCNLVIAMAHKETNEKSDGPDPCFTVLGKPGHKSLGMGTNKDSPLANVTCVKKVCQIWKRLNIKRLHLPKIYFYKAIN